MRGRIRAGIAGLLLLTLAVTGCSSGSGDPSAKPSPKPVTTSAASTSVAPAASSTRKYRPRATSRPKPHHSSTSTNRPAPKSTHASTGPVRRLPLHLDTANAKQVITVRAPNGSSTSGTLQRWRKVSGGWRRVGAAVDAVLGAAGIGNASEGSTRTPAGSFTLTQAFGHDSDPGTALPYFRTTPSDWWISQSGQLYNTHQHCSSACGFDRGSPNEHLYYETPYYDYAVVIDYNTRNAPGGVRPGEGSAFFLHVAVDPTTQGCVAVPSGELVQILRWLAPADHPRILIGTG